MARGRNGSEAAQRIRIIFRLLLNGREMRPGVVQFLRLHLEPAELQ